jgi:hypothetical protein
VKAIAKADAAAHNAVARVINEVCTILTPMTSFLGADSILVHAGNRAFASVSSSRLTVPGRL